MAFLLLAINVYSQEPSPPITKGQVQHRELKAKSSKKNQIEANKNKNISGNFIAFADPKSTIPSDSPTNSNKSPVDENKKPAIKDDPITRYTFWLTIFTFLIVLCNVALCYITKKSVDSLQAIERAYLSIDSIEWIDKTGPSTRSDYNKSTIRIKIVNSGKTPAIINTFDSDVDFKQDSYPSKESIIGKQALNPPEWMIAGGVTDIINFNAIVGPSVISDDDFMAAIILCCGRIKYEDIFGNNREMGFCYELRTNSNTGRFRLSNNRELNYHT